ncbi:HAD-IIA family hydrolase [Georgenia alba]|uniref:HAD-IIA family hydrolase n=1 Tax=Georgenia alba TaxID=2233858 RepID=A0ABW2QCF6_9MICO
MTDAPAQDAPPHGGLHASAQPLVAAFDVALLDVDGVCVRGGEPVEQAPEALAAARSAGLRTVFVTNNASRVPDAVAEKLSRAGIPTDAGDVTTSSQAAAALLAEDLPAGSLVLAVGGHGLRAALTEAGFRLAADADERPGAVVQGFGPEVGWRDLTEAALAVGAGARYLATNLDATLPMERGPALGNGSLVAAVTHATGVVPDSAGKPRAAIFRQAAARAAARRPLVVGDRLDTDLAGARAAGYPGLHVLTGVDDARAVVLATPDRRPSFLAADLRGLAEPHPAPVRADDGWWSCGSAAARYTGGPAPLEMRDGGGTQPVGPEVVDGALPVSLDALRCLATAAWDAADTGEVSTRGHLPLLRVAAPR